MRDRRAPALVVALLLGLASSMFGSACRGGGSAPAGNGVACPGFAAIAGYPTCVSDAECNGLTCVPAPESTDCSCPTSECTTTADCASKGTNRVCKPAPSLENCGSYNQCVQACPCSASEICAQGVCAPRSCTDGYACPSGLHCDTTVSRDIHDCTETSCNSGYTCPASATCVGGSPPFPDGVDNHGCQALSCTTDVDCPCGSCIQGSCAPNRWICQQIDNIIEGPCP